MPKKTLANLAAPSALLATLMLTASASATTLTVPTANTTHWSFSSSNTTADTGPATMTAEGVAGTTDTFVTATVGGASATVLNFTTRAAAADGYTVRTGIVSPADTGIRQFTMVLDIMFDNASQGYMGIWNGNATNSNDSEFFIRPDTGGFWDPQSGNFGAATLTLNQFHRVVYRMDYDGGDVDVFVDGTQVLTNGTPNDYVYDGDPNPFWFLTDNTPGETGSGQLAAFAFADTLLSDADITTLGSPDAAGIFVALPPPPAVTWSGSLSSEWSTNTLTSPKNWVLTSDGITEEDFFAFAEVTFDDSATTTTPDISGADVSAGNIIFDNTAQDFTLSGTNAIDSGQLDKDGTGRLTINNVNTFTGATNLNAGTIELGMDLALGTSPLSITSGADLHFGTLTTATLGGLNGDGDIVLENITPDPVALTLAGGGTHTGILSGSGSLALTGGTEQLGGPSTFAGGTTLTGGLLRMAHATALGSGTITHDGGALWFSFGDGSTTTVANDIVLPALGQTNSFYIKGDDGANITLPTEVTLTGLITGGAPGEVYRLLDSGQGGNNNHFVRFTNAANSFEGTIQMWRGNLLFTSDEALGAPENDIQHVTQNINGAITFDAPNLTLNAGRTIDFAAFGADNRPINTQTYDGTIAGDMIGEAAMRKQGTGKLTLTGATTFTGSANVDDGTLALEGSADLGAVTTISTAATGILDVTAIAPFNTFADLRGDGTIAGTTVASGNVAPGAADDVIGTLTTGDITLDYTYDAEIDSTLVQADSLVVNGNLTITSFVTELQLSDLAPAAVANGTKFVIAEYTGSQSGTFEFFDGFGFVTLNDGDTLTSGGIDYVIDYDDTTPGPNKYITLTVSSAVSPFDSWASGTGGLDGTPGKEAGFNDDPEGDQLDNGLEWILGGLPLLNDAASVLPDLEGSTGGGLTLTFTREEDSVGEATLLVQLNTDIDSAWNDVTVGATSSGPDANDVTVTIDTGTDPDTVTVNIPASNAPTGKIFARLSATMP